MKDRKVKTGPVLKWILVGEGRVNREGEYG
jgi:hypothetical protein